MTTISDFHPNIQATILFLTAQRSLQQLADEQNITKQAVHKRVQQGIEYLKRFRCTADVVSRSELEQALAEIKKLNALIQRLRRELVLASVQRQLLRLFKLTVVQFFPRFKNPPLQPYHKKMILDALSKFSKAGGTLKEFAKGIEKCVETLSRWEKAFQKYGLSGLVSKTKRPKNFGHKIPAWIKDELVGLFLKFPRWTTYQYHSYIRHNPVSRWYISLPTIKKLKQIYVERSEEEKKRLKKRWCFAKGSKVWTIDFTSLLKTDHFDLLLLTVSDHRSRFLLPTALFLHTSTQSVIDYLEELFIKFGKPDIIKVDNGPEFRLDCRNQLIELGVYLLNSPQYYGQFNGSHERIHRTLKTYIDDFNTHHNLTRLIEQIRTFESEYNYSMTFDYLEGRTPAAVYFNDQDFAPQNTEIVAPYEKDGELRMKFRARDDAPVRLSMALIMSVLKKFPPPSAA